MTIEAISIIVPFTGFIRPSELDDLESKEKSKDYINDRFEIKVVEEQVSVNPIYNSKGEIIDNIKKRYIEVFA